MHSLLLLSLVIAADTTTNWPQFRGPNGDGTALTSTLPTTWSEKENVKWKTAIHTKDFRGWASPVIWGDQIWLTDARNDGKEFYAVCLDKATGKVVHDLKLLTEEKPAFCHAFNSYASPTPAIEAGRVYCHFGSHGTVCLDTAMGKPVWERKDLKCDHWRGPGSSPILYQDLLILCFDGHDVQFVIALNKSTGETVWKQDRNIKYKNPDGDYHKAYGTPSVITVKGQEQLIAPSAENTIAYEPKTGKELWRIATDGMNQSIKPILANDLIFLSAGHKSELLAVKAGKTGLLTPGDIVWSMKKEAPVRPSILVLKDRVYMANDKGIANCLDVKTGKNLWKERFDSEFSASPVSDGKNVYFCNQDGKTFVIAASDDYTVVATNKLDAGCMASPAVSGNELFLRTKTHLYCIGTK
ncbi:PQQ-binding-like beta-propeller repeat protein [soil metagenome]